MNKATVKKTVILVAVLALIGIGYFYLREYATLEFVKSKQIEFKAYYDANRVLVLLVFFLIYVGVTALSLPGAALMTLLAGALFGLLIGVLLVSFASSIGATLAFLVARFLIGKSLQEKYGDSDLLKKINDGISNEGAFYLFTMRLIPAIPFFLINLLMALTKIPALTFYWVSQVGMLAGTVVYVYAGTELAKIEDLKDILSPTLIGAFIAIGVFPLAAKKFIGFIRARRQA